MPRRNLATNTSWDDIYNYLSYIQIALSLAVEDEDKELAALVPPVKKLLARWEAMDGERRGRQSEVIRANALVGRRDLGLDEATTALHNAVLSAASLNRKAPLFTRLFPRPLSQIVGMSLEAQLGVSRALLHKVAQAETPAAIRKTQEGPLKEAIAAGEAAIKNRELARAAQQEFSARIAALREEANNVLLTLEGSLKAIAGKRGLGAGFVNTFFPAGQPAGKRRAAPEPAPTPTPG